jgi:alpha/beta superfamily hydrolase
MSDVVTETMMVQGRQLEWNRRPISLVTSDCCLLGGALGRPAETSAVGCVILLHPNPTGGGSMDSHLFRSALEYLPSQHDISVLAFNTRGTDSESACSDGVHDDGCAEKADVAAAVSFVKDLRATNIWLVGWSFGTDLALMHGCLPGVRGAFLLAPVLHRTTPEHLRAWSGSGRELTCLVPEFDKYLRIREVRSGLASVPQTRFIEGEGMQHSFMGHTDDVLETIAATVTGREPSCARAS